MLNSIAGYIILFLILFGLILYLREIIKNNNLFYLFFLIWLIMHNLFYIYFLPTRGHTGRYQPENYLFLILVITLPVIFLNNSKNHLRKYFSYCLIFLILFINFSSLVFWQRIYSLSVKHINEIHVSLGKFIRDNTPKTSLIAAYDIGAIAYFSDRKIIDMSCLTDQECIIYRQKDELVKYIASNKAEYLAMPEFDQNNDFLSNLYSQLDKIGVLRTPIKTYDFGTWEDNVVTWNTVPRIGFYKLIY